MFEKYPEVLTTAQLAEALCIGKSTAYRLVRSKRIRTIRVGSKILIPKASVVSSIMRKLICSLHE